MEGLGRWYHFYTLRAISLNVGLRQQCKAQTSRDAFHDCFKVVQNNRSSAPRTAISQHLVGDKLADTCVGHEVKEWMVFQDFF